MLYQARNSINRPRAGRIAVPKTIAGYGVRGIWTPLGYSGAPPVVTGTKPSMGNRYGLARGFYTSIGLATTDRIDTGITGTNTTGVSYLVIVSQLSIGATAGRIFTQNDQHIWTAVASSNMTFLLGANAPAWTVPQLTAQPTVNVITYAGGTADPKMWRDGVSQTVAYVSGTRSGAITSVASNVFLGNRTGGDRGHDGAIGLFIQFDSVLDDQIAQLLSKNPALYLPLFWDMLQFEGGGGGGGGVFAPYYYHEHIAGAMHV